MRRAALMRSAGHRLVFLPFFLFEHRLLIAQQIGVGRLVYVNVIGRRIDVAEYATVLVILHSGLLPGSLWQAECQLRTVRLAREAREFDPRAQRLGDAPR